MSEHVTWEATLAEVVDAHLRAFGKSGPGRRAFWLGPMGFGFSVGLFVAIVRPGPIPMRVAWGALWATFATVIFITMFRRSLRRRLTQHLQASLGESPGMAYRLEVDGDEVRARQGTDDRRYHLAEVVEIDDGAKSLTVVFADGFFLVVPSRAFPSDDARAALTGALRARSPEGA